MLTKIKVRLSLKEVYEILLLDDVADRFFIILKGQVGVYKRREESIV